MTDIEGFLTIYGHSDNLLNNNIRYPARPRRIIVNYMNTSKRREREKAVETQIDSNIWFSPCAFYF